MNRQPHRPSLKRKELTTFEENWSPGPDAIIARSWAQMGLRYAKERYYYKAFLCFETALSLDSLSVDAHHLLIRRLILTGKIQEVCEFALKVTVPPTGNLVEPWAVA